MSSEDKDYKAESLIELRDNFDKYTMELFDNGIICVHINDTSNGDLVSFSKPFVKDLLNNLERKVTTKSLGMAILKAYNGNIDKRKFHIVYQYIVSVIEIQRKLRG